MSEKATPVILKLSTGEVLIAKMVDDSEPGVLTIVDVLRVAEIMVEKENRANISLLPFMPYTKAVDMMVIGMNQLVFITEPAPEIAEGYTQHFASARARSGLALPPSAGKGLVIPE